MKETKRQLGNSFSAMSGSLEDADPESSEMNLETAVGAVGDNSAFGPASRLPAPTTFLWLWPTRDGVAKAASVVSLKLSSATNMAATFAARNNQ